MVDSLGDISAASAQKTARGEARRVLPVTLLVACFYVVFTVVALGMHDRDPFWFVWAGERYADLDPEGRTGYDGQFAYYLASYGSRALPHLDNPAYRLQRILQPAVVRVLSMGVPALVPWMLIAVNLAAIVVATHLLAKWLCRQELSPWYALMYAFYIGTFLSYSRDLTEPLALCLVILGATLWFRGQHAWALFSLALAILAKETMLLFVLGIALSELASRRPALAIKSLAALLPLLLWEGFLFAMLGTVPMTAGPSLEWIPLRGILPHVTLEPGRISALFFVGVLGVALLPTSALLLLRQRGRSPAPWWLLLHCALVILLPPEVYDHIMHAGRNAGGMVVSAAFLLPLLATPLRLSLLGFWTLPTFIWLVPVLRWAPWLSEV